MYSGNGYLYELMSNVSHSVMPGVDRTIGLLTNRAIGGSTGSIETACLRTFVPPQTADLVFLDFFLGHQNVAYAIHTLITIVKQLRMQAFGPQPPFVVIMLNRYWCLTESGDDPNNVDTRVDGQSTLMWTNKSAMCRRGDDEETFRRASVRVAAETKQVQHAVNKHFSPQCGGVVVLSVFEEVAPLIIAGKLRAADFSVDGVHPITSPGVNGAPDDLGLLTRAWGDVLKRWAADILQGGTPPTARATDSGASAATASTEVPRSCNKEHAMESAGLCYGAEFFLPRPTVLLNDGFAHCPYCPKPGWTSSRQGASMQVRIDSGKLGTLEAQRGTHQLGVDLHLLHTYTPENAGTALVSCVGGCTCANVSHSTLWKATISSDWGVPIGPISIVDASRDCALQLVAASNDRVKLRGMRVGEFTPSEAGMRAFSAVYLG